MIASGSRVDSWTHIGVAMAEFLTGLVAEAEANARLHGPLRGPVLERQRPWSRLLDVLEHGRQGLLEDRSPRRSQHPNTSQRWKSTAA